MLGALPATSIFVTTAISASGAFVHGREFMTMISNYPGESTAYQFTDRVAVVGWWIAGDIPAVDQLPFTGRATYTATPSAPWQPTIEGINGITSAMIG